MRFCRETRNRFQKLVFITTRPVSSFRALASLIVAKETDQFNVYRA